MVDSARPDTGEAGVSARERSPWAEDEGITWDTASDEIREQFALVRLFWFYRMVASGGPDGSELDADVADEARIAADWLGPVLMRRAGLEDPDD